MRPHWDSFIGKSSLRGNGINYLVRFRSSVKTDLFRKYKGLLHMCVCVVFFYECKILKY